MLDLESAIKYCEEVAEENKKKASWFWVKEGNPNYENCVECATEHRQLAEWLYQLKQIKDIVQEHHDNYIEWGTGQSSIAFHKIVKIIVGGDGE